MTAGTYNLKVSDVSRIESTGKNVVPGTPNTRLIGGRWRFLQRPVEGDVVYTDCECLLEVGVEFTPGTH